MLPLPNSNNAVGIADKRLIPLFTKGRPPSIFLGQRPLLTYIIDELDRLSRYDKSLLRSIMGRELHGDVEALVLGAMRAADLTCTNPGHLVHTGLMILCARHRGAPEFAAFLGTCLKRWLDGKSLRLTGIVRGERCLTGALGGSSRTDPPCRRMMPLPRERVLL